MKKLKLKLSIIVLFLGCMVAIGQALKDDKSSSVGNAKLMEENLNFPNATIPPKNNIQEYDKGDNDDYKNIHPDEDLSNTYNRHCYDNSNK